MNSTRLGLLFAHIYGRGRGMVVGGVSRRSGFQGRGLTELRETHMAFLTTLLPPVRRNHELNPVMRLLFLTPSLHDSHSHERPS